jgi:hypothetical protein
LSCPGRHFFFDYILIVGANFINFGFDSYHGGEESRESLWDDNTSEVETFLFSLDDDSNNIINQFFKIPTFMFDLLTDNGVVRMGGKGTLKSEMGRVSAHEPDEVPVLCVGGGINHKV